MLFDWFNNRTQIRCSILFDCRTQLNDWCSIEFWFDFVRLDTPGENDVLFSNDTGILGKRNSKFSQQESNPQPSDY